MAHHSVDTMNRRQFIKIILSTGAVTAIGFKPAFGDEAKAGHWAFFSDTHIKTEDDHAKPPKNHHYYNQHAHLQRAVREALAAKPEGTIITGDLARLTGDLENYEKLHALLTPLMGSIPVFSSMGNHDSRDHFGQIFTGSLREKQEVPGKYVLVIEKGPVRFIILDSNMAVNKGTGQLGEAQLQWLGNYLKKCDDRPTCLCMHHNPDDSGKGFQDWPQLLELVRPVKKVKAAIYGHSHVFEYDEKDGIQLINLPALGYSFKADQPVGWMDARFTAEGAAFKMHVIDGPKDQDGKTKRLKWRA